MIGSRLIHSQPLRRIITRRFADAPKPAVSAGVPSVQPNREERKTGAARPGIDASFLIGGAAALALIAGGIYYYDRIADAVRPAPPPAQKASAAVSKTAIAAAPNSSPKAPAAEEAITDKTGRLNNAKHAVAELDAFLLANQLVADEHAVSAASDASKGAADGARAAAGAASSTEEVSSTAESASPVTTPAPAGADVPDALSNALSHETDTSPAAAAVATPPLAAAADSAAQSASSGAENAPAATGAAAAAASPDHVALAASRGWLADRMGRILQQEVSGAVVGGEVVALSVEELRERILRLSMELSQRAKWEALHLKELVDENDKIWISKMKEFVADKSAELETAQAAALAAAKSALTAESEDAMRRERESLRAALTEEAATNLRSTLQELFARVGEETESRLSILNAMQARLEAVDTFLAARSAYDEDSHREHKATLALLALLTALEKAGPASQEIAALGVALQGRDPLVSHALAMLPSEAVHSAQGVPTLHALQTRYAAVQKAARRAALTPESSGILGQAIGAATSMLVIPARSPASVETSSGTEGAAAASAPTAPPSAVAQALKEARSRLSSAFAGLSTSASSASPPAAAAEGVKQEVTVSLIEEEEESPVEKALKSAQSRAKELASSAQEVSSDVQRILARFDAAQVAVDEGDLEDAVAQLESLSGYAGEAVKDWIADARQRIACDEAVSLLQSRAVIRAATLY